MKLHVVLYTLAILAFDQAFSQCPEPGLKIQSAACETPSNLKVDAISCTELKVKWHGNQSQHYIIKATGTENATGKIFESVAAKSSCDYMGNCSATVPVVAAAELSWTVQGICTEGNSSLNSYPVMGEKVNTPFCNPANNSASLKVYPNPAERNLSVEYNGELTASTKFIIMDVQARQAMTIPASAITRTGTGFVIDLGSFTSGTYVLQVINGKDSRQAKFVLIRN